MGSKSDYPVVQKAEQMLENFGVEYETRIISAHRTPKQAEQFAADAEGSGFGCIIAAAGKAAHLAGVLAATTPLPVIGIPMKSSTTGRTRFASFRGADAKRRAGRNSCDRRRGKRSAAGSPDPERQQIRRSEKPSRLSRKSRKKISSRSTANSTNRRTDNMNDTQEV